MCTLSWAPLPGGYALAMNRDERRSRPRAAAPAEVSIRHRPVLMPTDPEGGGTWISVNDRGTTLALLNRYDESPKDEGDGFTSRGLLVRELAWAAGPGEVHWELGAHDLARFRPFTLAVVSPEAEPHLFEWDRAKLESSVVVVPGLLRASSGSDQVEAERARGSVFREAASHSEGLTPGILEALHRSHHPERGPLSICMHRDEASTVSLTLITVNAHRSLIRYVDGPPGETIGAVERSLHRRGFPPA